MSANERRRGARRGRRRGGDGVAGRSEGAVHAVTYTLTLPAGDAVVVTVPLGCLKAGDVRFQPPLPEEKQAAIRGLGYGLLNKVPRGLAPSQALRSQDGLRPA